MTKSDYRSGWGDRPVVDYVVPTRGPERLRRKRRRAPTRAVVVVSAITHVVTLVITAASLSALETSLACAVIAVTAFLAGITRLLTGALRFREREIDLCWLTFHASVMFWFCLPGFTRAIQDNWYKDAALVQVTPESFGWAWVGIVVFVAAFDTLYALVRPGPKARDKLRGFLGAYVRYEPRTLIVVLSLLIGAVFLNYAMLSGGIGPLVDQLLALRGGGEERAWSSEGNYSTRLSTFHALTEAMIVIVAIVSGDLCLNGRLKGKARYWGGVLWLLACGFETLIGAGTRSGLALVICAPLSLYVRIRLIEGLGARRVAALVLAAISLLWFSSFLRASRSSTEGLRSGGSEDVSFVYHDDVDFVASTALSYDIYRISGEQTFNESALWMILVNPIPRWIWTGKPEPKIVVTYSWWDWGVDISVVGGNSLPSVVGQSLLSWGWLGVVLTGVGWGLMAALGDAAVRDTQVGWSLIVWGLITWWMFTAFRFVGPSFFAAPYFLLIGLNSRQLLTVLTRVHQRLGLALRPEGIGPQ